MPFAELVTQSSDERQTQSVFGCTPRYLCIRVDGSTAKSLPSRAHLLFRGLEGAPACVDLTCPHRGDDVGVAPLLGKFYDSPHRHCVCGSRVYELLTHRDCGAAYIRAYSTGLQGDFLWHEPSKDLAGQGTALYEVHLLVEHERTGRAVLELWPYKRTGQLWPYSATQLRNSIWNFESLRAPSSSPGRSIITFDRQCPACQRRRRDATRPKIMDLDYQRRRPFSPI